MVRSPFPVFLLLAASALGQPIGTRVDIGDRSLHIVCMGQGPHTVVMESGVATAFYEWWLVQSALKNELRTCSYDRAGFGWSDPTPSRSVAGYVDDLHELLRRNGEKPPFILVGHSMGGPFVERYYWRYPSEVAGLILVDPANAEAGFTAIPEYKQAAATQRAKRTKEMEAWREKNAWPKQTFPSQLPSDLRSRLVEASASRNWWEARFAEGSLPDLEISTTPEQRKIRVPLVIIGAKSRNPSGWSDEMTDRFRKHMREEQDEIASRSPDAVRIEVDTGHDVPMEAPGVIVKQIQLMASHVWGR